jgi:hypothetical protein
MGHIFGKDGFHVDPHKIPSMKDWPHPKTFKILQGFLGLMGYYRKFVRNYGKNAASLIARIKKNAFSWTRSTSDQSFQSVK